MTNNSRNKKESRKELSINVHLLSYLDPCPFYVGKQGGELGTPFRYLFLNSVNF